MYDSMELGKACGDIYDAGVNDDNLALIYEANKNVKIKVKTPGAGLTKEEEVNMEVLQGDVIALILASIQVDSFGKELLEDQPSLVKSGLLEPLMT